jgi:glucose-6-phosphate-specific signal transduction histidine kinase
MRFLRAHVDAVLAVLLVSAQLAWLTFGGEDVASEPDPVFIDLSVDAFATTGAGLLFLVALALRSRWPLVPLGLAFMALATAGRGQLEASPVILIGVLLASYSVGAWTGARSALAGALAVGVLACFAVVRSAEVPLVPREVAGPMLLIVGTWAVGLAIRTLRADRGDPRVTVDADEESPRSAAEQAGRDALVRDLRELIERSMSTVVLRSRAARASLTREPARAERALVAIEAAGTEALEETQRLTGLLLSPRGAALPLPPIGLRDLDELAVQVSEAGLPVTTRVEGRPVALSPDLDAVALRVAQAALYNALEGTTDGQASVVVRFGRDELQVEVVDDGVPVEADVAGEAAAGLLAVRDEVAVVGGTLDAGPGEERGYWVLARLPYEPDDELI